jgi:hypothetical protein
MCKEGDEDRKKKRQLCQTSSLLVEMEKGMEITCINKVLIYVFIK